MHRGAKLKDKWRKLSLSRTKVMLEGGSIKIDASIDENIWKKIFPKTAEHTNDGKKFVPKKEQNC